MIENKKYTKESIFLDENWAHQKYYGWKIIYKDTKNNLLLKSFLFINRYLLLSIDSSKEEIVDIVNKIRYPKWLSYLVVHDFSGKDLSNVLIKNTYPSQSTEDNLIFFDKTLVVDLRKNEEELWNDLSKEYRRKCDKAMKLGIIVKKINSNDLYDLELFYKEYLLFSKQKMIQVVSLEILKKMVSNNDLIIFKSTLDGNILSTILVYTANKKSIFLYGMNHEKVNNGNGQYIHWKIIEYLKENNYVSYDLCGIRSTDMNDGLYKFKSGFTSNLVDLGNEWHSNSPLIDKIKPVYKNYCIGRDLWVKNVLKKLFFLF
ncbi:MAG: peptidoglycan bridge formation glycyltransferase FemA/FemB family protein [Methylococcales bacterium]|nr:peptidoglycan bridge formation glycyltransferase FemA/FemB family protein [Methylococcales bacterium]